MCRFDISLEFVKFIHYTISQYCFYKISTQMSFQALFFLCLFDLKNKLITLFPTSVFVFLPILNAQYIHINYYHLQVPIFFNQLLAMAKTKSKKGSNELYAPSFYSYF
jgi:hypothetical protein